MIFRNLILKKVVLLTTLFALPALAISQDLGRVVLIQGPAVCATGFILDARTIVTNQHVANEICASADGNCHSLTISSTSSENEMAVNKLFEGSLSIEKTFPGLDVVYLTAPENTFKTNPTPFSTEQLLPKSTVTILGFPICTNKKLIRSVGYIDEVRADSIAISANLAHGNSGSPIFDDTGKLIAVVSATEDVQAGLSNLLIGGQIENAKAARGDLIQELSDSSSQKSVALQADWLWENYKSLIKESGLRRVTVGGQFISTVLELKSEMAKQEFSEDYPTLWKAGELPITGSIKLLKSNAEGSTARSLQRIAFAERLESSGINLSIGHAYSEEDLNEIEKILTDKSKINDPDLIKTFQAIRESKYPGLERYAVRVLFPWLLLVIAAGFVWAFSLGGVFTSSKGNIAERLATAIVVGLAIWPLSLLGYWFIRSRAKHP